MDLVVVKFGGTSVGDGSRIKKAAQSVVNEYMKGNSLYECLKMGNETANVILHNYGCTFAKNFEFKTFQI